MMRKIAVSMRWRLPAVREGRIADHPALDVDGNGLVSGVTPAPGRKRPSHTGRGGTDAVEARQDRPLLVH